MLWKMFRNFFSFYMNDTTVNIFSKDCIKLLTVNIAKATYMTTSRKTAEFIVVCSNYGTSCSYL